MSDALRSAAHDLAKVVLNISDPSPANLRAWLVQAELNATAEQAYALNVLAGREDEASRFLWSHERTAAALVDAFCEKCAGLESNQREARIGELLDELASISAQVQPFPHLAARLTKVEQVLAIKLTDEQRAKAPKAALGFAERLLRQNLQCLSKRAVARRGLLMEAYDDKKAWAKNAAYVKRHLGDIAKLDAPLVEELAGLSGQQLRTWLLALHNQPTAGMNRYIRGGAVVLLALLLSFKLGMFDPEVTPNNRSPAGAAAKRKPSPNPLAHSRVGRDIKRVEQLKDILRSDGGTIVHRVEMACLCLRIAKSQDLVVMLALTGKTPQDLERTYILQARQLLPRKYRPSSSDSIDDIFEACRRIAADHEEHAVDILTHTIETAEALGIDKYTSEEDQQRRYSIVVGLNLQLSAVADSPHVKRSAWENAIQWQLRAHAELAGTDEAMSELCNGVSDFVLFSVEAGLGDQIPNFLLRTRNEAQGLLLNDRQQKMLILCIAGELGRAHARLAGGPSATERDESSTMIQDRQEELMNLVDAAVATLLLVASWSEAELTDLYRHEHFQSLQSDVEFRRFCRQPGEPLDSKAAEGRAR